MMTQQSSPAKTQPDPHELGKRGEEYAAAYLQQAGCSLVAANFKVPVGRNLAGAMVHAEIDLIVYEKDILCFVEVKTRASDWFAAPQANVDLRKQRQIARAARAYRRIFGVMDEPYRYDVVAIVLPPGDIPSNTHASDEHASTEPHIEILRNFWSDQKFRKRRWGWGKDEG